MPGGGMDPDRRGKWECPNCGNPDIGKPTEPLYCSACNLELHVTIWT